MTEEDKKTLASMLGKLYVTANSSPEKLSTVNELVIEAIDGKIASEAASKTALNKLHLAVSKALQEVGKGRLVEAEQAAKPEITPEGCDEAVTNLAEAVEATSIVDGQVTMEEVIGVEEDTKDSILDELLDDEEDDL